MGRSEKAGQEGNRMNFDDVGRFIVIITVISNYVITASQIIKIKEEKTLDKIYKEILHQRMLLITALGMLALQKVDIRNTRGREKWNQLQQYFLQHH